MADHDSDLADLSSMAIFLPILYLMGGLTLGKMHPSVRDPLSRILAKQLIPFVIACSLATYHPGTGTITLIGLLFCLLMFGIGKLIWRDRLTPLLISYLNVGWLGLPIATAILGDNASRVIIAAYIGNSVFGNVAAVLAMQAHTQWQTIVKRTLFSPPVIAVFIGLAIHATGVRLADFAVFQALYALGKVLMSAFGIGVLGIWLYQSPISRQSLLDGLPITIIRAVAGFVLLALIWLGLNLTGLHPPQSLIPLLLLPLLPPAANIIVLETHYLGSGKAAQHIVSNTLLSFVSLALFTVWTVFYL